MRTAWSTRAPGGTAATNTRSGRRSRGDDGAEDRDELLNERGKPAAPERGGHGPRGTAPTSHGIMRTRHFKGRTERDLAPLQEAHGPLTVASDTVEASHEGARLGLVVLLAVDRSRAARSLHGCRIRE